MGSHIYLVVDFPEPNIDISWYKPIFDNAQEGIMITDPAGNILMVNNPALALFGYTNEEIKQKNIIDLYATEKDRENTLTKLKKDGNLKNYQVTLVTKSGRILKLVMNSNPIYNAQGELVAIHSNFIHQASSVLTKQSLQESEQRYRTLVEHAPDAITVLDTGTMKFHDVNLKALEFFKMSREELLNKSPVDLTPTYLPSGEQSEIVAMQKIQEAIDGGNPVFDWVHIDADGKHIPCQVQLIRLPDSVRVLVRGSIIDMTEKFEAAQKLKKSQMELAQAQKMEALGRLAGGVAHDFNNTLTVILGYCELIKYEIDDQHELYEMINEIEKAGLKSTHLVKQLLTFSRKEEPVKGPVDVNQIIRETANLLRHLIGEDIRIEINLDNEIGLIDAHPTHITQILMNLVVNAREAMPTGGILKISTHDYMLMNAKGELHHSVFLYVSDTGAGINEEIIDQIFEPFFTTKTTGTGLGLSTVYGIVEELNGTIKVTSTPEEGTTFQLTFPLSNQESSKQKAPNNKLDKTILKGKHAMIVEDDDIVGNLVVKFLEEFGMDVTATMSPYKAIELLKTTDYDIIISDMIMPEMSGIEMVTEMKRQSENLKILFVTGYMNQPQLLKVMENGYPVLYKPFNRNNLLTMISQIFHDNL